ncbi:MAG: toll/interleukin-1 receptor domain-containing protein [Promethearchaeota archaeon]
MIDDERREGVETRLSELENKINTVIRQLNSLKNTVTTSNPETQQILKLLQVVTNGLQVGVYPISMLKQSLSIKDNIIKRFPKIKYDEISKAIISVLEKRGNLNLSKLTAEVRILRGKASRRIIRERVNELIKDRIIEELDIGFGRQIKLISPKETDTAFSPLRVTPEILTSKTPIKKLTKRYQTPEIPSSYNGEELFIFVSYSRNDKEFIYSEINKLNNDGFRVWYDEGIPLSTKWNSEVAKALKKSSCFLVFISNKSVKSQNVQNEINFALKYKKNIIPVYLEETILPEGLELQLITIQGIHKHMMEETQYRKKINSNLKEILQQFS